MTSGNDSEEPGDDELGQLVTQLHDIQQRIFQLTGGKVDAVVGPGHRPVLLPHAQEWLQEKHELNRRHKEQLAAIMDALPAHVALLDADGYIVDVNEGWRRFSRDNGLQNEDAAIGMNYFDACESAEGPGGDNADEAARGIRSVINGTQPSFTLEYPCHAPDRKRWFQLLVSPLPEGGDRNMRGGAVVMHVDITQRKLAELEIFEAKERLEKVIQEASTGIIVRQRFKPVMANEEIAHIFGYPNAETIMGFEDVRALLSEEDRDRETAYTEARMRGEPAPTAYELKGVSGDGRELDLEIRAFTITWGDQIAICEMITDATEQNRIREQLQRAQKLETIGHLTGGVAHDFNNLLTVIMGNAELLAEKATDERMVSLAEATLSAAERGAELTGRLLAYARRKPLDPRPADINRLLESMWPLVQRTLPESIDLEFAPNPDLGTVEIDAAELENALLNLVVNAIDAMEENGKLMIETANVMLDKSYANRHAEVDPGEFVMICVSDTGTGMDTDTLQRVYEPFFSTKDVGKGSGLGLSMVFGFTKQSGGHIKIYSEPGEGTVVKMYFPRLHTGQKTDFKPAINDPLQGGNEHILIAEDDELVLEHLKNQLVSLGYRVSTASSGPEALGIMQARDDIDLLLTDVVMPGGMNGRELAERVLAVHPSLKVLFTSGYTENALIHHGRLDPGVTLLSKPYTRVELATKVRRVLDDVPQQGGHHD